jgi:hypothetical protein
MPGIGIYKKVGLMDSRFKIQDSYWPIQKTEIALLH